MKTGTFKRKTLTATQNPSSGDLLPGESHEAATDEGHVITESPTESPANFPMDEAPQAVLENTIEEQPIIETSYEETSSLHAAIQATEQAPNTIEDMFAVASQAPQQPALQSPQAVRNTTQAFDTVTLLMRPTVSPSACVRALEKALAFGRNALYLELGMSLAAFVSSSTGADRSTKRVIMGIYEQAGFNIEVGGPDYKTVRRRIDAAASLYHKLGKREVEQVASGLREGKAIDALSTWLSSTYNFTGINSVLELAGKKHYESKASRAISEKQDADNATASSVAERIKMRQPALPMRVIDEDEGSTVVFSGALSLLVPKGCTAQDVRAMATKLNDFADRLEMAEIESRDENAHI